MLPLQSVQLCSFLCGLGSFCLVYILPFRLQKIITYFLTKHMFFIAYSCTRPLFLQRGAFFMLATQKPSFLSGATGLGCSGLRLLGPECLKKQSVFNISAFCIHACHLIFIKNDFVFIATFLGAKPLFLLRGACFMISMPISRPPLGTLLAL